MVCMVAVGYSQEKNFIDQNYVSVTGYNKMKVTPDMIYISITINESDTKGKVSLDQMERNMVKALEKTGIDVSKQLSVSDMSSNFKKYALKKQDVMQSKNYTLLVYDARSAAEVFMALEKENISNATITDVDHSKLIDHKLESKTQAIKDAKRKAEALAQGVDRSIGKAMYIVDNERNYYSARSNTMVYAMAKGSADMAYDESMPEIQFQEIEIESTVTVYFELK